jgi:hypothetical protein
LAVAACGPRAVRPNAQAAASFPHQGLWDASIFGKFANGLELKEETASAIPEPLPRLKSSGDSTLSQHGQETTAMVITSAHISPIIALIAGILILVMPRLLNLIVAIYLICVGLIGLGVLKWLHM